MHKFYREREWSNTSLTKNDPCNGCKPYEYDDEICNTCLKRTMYEIDCYDKLKWYEENDERLK